MHKFKKRKKFLIFGSPAIEKEEIREVTDTLKSGWIGTGPKVQRFEKMFKTFKGINYSIAVSSCTAALHLALIAVGIKNQDEVIVPTLTFAATANAVIHAGGVPVLVDSEKETMNLDPKKVEEKITDKTKAIIVVHFAGRPVDMDEILKISEKYKLKVIEDCAHAIESEYKGKKTGTIGDIGCFSFYTTKNIITGEGGMVTTNSRQYAKQIKTLALHGMSDDAWDRFSDDGYKHYEITFPGFKYNMMDIQASLGIHQLPRIDKYWNRRKKIWDFYNSEFKGLPVFLPADFSDEIKHSFHLYIIILDIDNLNISRNEFINQMTKLNIGVGVHYTPIHLHPYYKERFGYQKGDFPDSEWVSERTVSLPLSPKLKKADALDVVNTVKTILLNAKKNY
ncbi:MAG: DegT/DnrJ/EryC1/StrS family aminotransferase [Acidobacteriota bacterium]